MSGAVHVDDLVPCTNRVDIWALGVTVYELLAGGAAPTACGTGCRLCSQKSLHLVQLARCFLVPSMPLHFRGLCSRW